MFTTCRLLSLPNGLTLRFIDAEDNQNEGTALAGSYAARPRLKLDAPATGLSREKSAVAPLPVSRGRLATAGAEVVGAGGAGCTSTRLGDLLRAAATRPRIFTGTADERAVRGRGLTDAPTLDTMSLVPVDQTITKAVERVSVLAGREVDVSVLAGGFTNDVFLVRADDERYVFRIPGQSSDLLEINRADERYNAEMAARAGVSPDVVDYVEGMDVMVLEFIDGHVPTIEDLQTPDQVRRIAEAVRTLHGGPRFNNDADMFDRGKRWLEACNEVSIRVPDGIDSRMGELDDIARALAVNPLPTVPCHNDLAPYNFIDDGDRLWIIDFEFSGNNDPCSDLGMIASEAELDEDLRTILCEAYFGDATPSLLARLKLYAVLSNVGWSLYCAIQAVVLSDESYWDEATGFWKAVVEALDSDEMPSMLRAVVGG